MNFEVPRFLLLRNLIIRARSLTARSAAQRPCLRPWLRPRLPWPQASEAAQLKPGAICSPQPAPIQSSATGSPPGMWRIAGSPRG
eukprot:1627987-Prymnesium_polylepis.1